MAPHRDRRSLFLAAGGAMFVFGITLAALGALFGMAEVRERIHVDLAQQGDIFLMLYFGVFVSTIIVGPGGGGLNTAANALVADLYPDNRGTMLNLLGVFYGCGAVLIVSSSQYLLPVGMTLAAICAIAYLILPFPRPKEGVGFSLFASARRAVRDGRGAPAHPCGSGATGRYFPGAVLRRLPVGHAPPSGSPTQERPYSSKRRLN
jgi:MFS family permease